LRRCYRGSRCLCSSGASRVRRHRIPSGTRGSVFVAAVQAALPLPHRIAPLQGFGAAEEEALGVGGAQAFELCQFRFGFDTFGNDHAARFAGEGDQG
jgi:hypothetical protein